MTRRRVITVTQAELLHRLRAARGRRLLVSAKPGRGNRYVLVEDVPEQIQSPDGLRIHLDNDPQIVND